MNDYLKSNENFDPNIAVVTSDIDGIPVKEEILNLNITESSFEHEVANIIEDTTIYSPSEKIKVARYRFNK